MRLIFFRDHDIPLWEMENRNKLIGNPENTNEKYCLAKEGELYLLYLGHTNTSSLDLTGHKGTYSVRWFNPGAGGELQEGSVTNVQAGDEVKLGEAPNDPDNDWLVVLRKD
jgi:hypothetical protein